MCLTKALLMSTHNICFHGKIRKILSKPLSLFSGAMENDTKGFKMVANFCP